jgi:hypothetical protein
VRNAEQSHRDRIHDGRIDRDTRHMQTRTFAVARFAAVVLAIGLLAAFMLSAGWIAGHLSRRRFVRRRHASHRHGVTQLTDDQTGHQQENQGPALPAEFTHGARLQANVAARNDAGIKSESFSEAASYTTSAVL